MTIKENTLTRNGMTVVITDTSSNKNVFSAWFRIDKKIDKPVGKVFGFDILGIDPVQDAARKSKLMESRDNEDIKIKKGQETLSGQLKDYIASNKDFRAKVQTLSEKHL